jgi:hypothetical protein
VVSIRFDHLKRNSFIYFSIYCSKISASNIQLKGEFTEDVVIKKYSPVSYRKHKYILTLPYIISFSLILSPAAVFFDLQHKAVFAIAFLLFFFLPDSMFNRRAKPLDKILQQIFNNIR